MTATAHSRGQLRRVGPVWVGVVVSAFGFALMSVRLPAQELALLAAGAVAFSSVVVLAYRAPAAAVSAFFVYLSVDGMFRMLLNYHRVVHLAVDALTVALCLGAGTRAAQRGSGRFAFGPVEALLAGFALLCVCQVFNPSTDLLLGVMGLKVHLIALPLYFFGYYLRQDAEDERRYCLLFCGIATFVCAFALIQYLTGPEFWTSLGPTYAEKIAREQWWDESGTLYFRPPSTTISGSWPGLYAMISIPLAIGLAMSSRFRQTAPLLLGAVAVQTASLIISTFRGGWLSLAAGLALFCALRRTPRTGAVILGVGIGCVAAMWITKGSVSARVETLRNPVATFVEERGRAAVSILSHTVSADPFGLGTGTSSVAAEYYERFGGKDAVVRPAENYFVSLAVELGVVGLAAMLLCLGTILRLGFRAFRQATSDDDRAMTAAMLSTATAILLTGMVGPVLHGSFPAAYFWFLAGMLVRRAVATGDQSS